jgi:hypothetical protein
MSSNTERANPKEPAFVASGETLIARLRSAAYEMREHDRMVRSAVTVNGKRQKSSAFGRWAKLVEAAVEVLSSPREGAVILTPRQIEDKEEDESRGGTQAVSERQDPTRVSLGRFVNGGARPNRR